MHALLLVAVVATNAFGQLSRSEIEIIQEEFGLEKKAAVAQFLELGDDAKAFWTLYDAYEAERKILADQRIEVLRAYASSFPNLSDEKIVELLDQTTAVKKAIDKLQEKYFNLMRKELGTSKAAQFWQLETYFNVMIQAAIYSQIPFIGEKLEDK